jgi:hypothetical protein
VSPGSTAKYSDLLKLVFTDLSPKEGTAHQTIPIRHVSGDHEEEPLHGDFKIDFFEVVALRDPQGPVVVVEIEVTTDDEDKATVYGADSGIVAAFRISPSLKLLDALDVKTDRFTGMLEKPSSTIPISSNQTALLISNSHHNAGQGYQQITAFFLKNHRLARLFTAASPPRRGFLVASGLFLLGDRTFEEKTRCEVTTVETTAFFPVPQAGEPYFKIGVRIRVTTTAKGEDCKSPRRYSRYYRGSWEWDASKKRFRPSAGGNLERLDKFNERRM